VDSQKKKDILDGVRRTGRERHLVIPRLIAGAPLLLIGLSHAFVDSTPMRPIVEAAGVPAAGVLSPVAVAAEIVAGALLLLGFLARPAALLAIGVMVVAVYAHLAIDVWPNVDAEEPPLALPLAVIACSAYVLWRGAGRWSLDRAGAAKQTTVAVPQVRA
jgi:putative oxidoreductase